MLHRTAVPIDILIKTSSLIMSKLMCLNRGYSRRQSVPYYVMYYVYCAAYFQKSLLDPSISDLYSVVSFQRCFYMTFFNITSNVLVHRK